MSLFNNIFQQILGETKEEIEKEKDSLDKNFLKQSKGTIELDFTDYSSNLEPELEEEDDDGSYYRDKDRERELENRLKKLKKSKRDSKRNEDTKKSDNKKDEYNKTAEKNQDRDSKKRNKEEKIKLGLDNDEKISRRRKIAKFVEQKKKKEMAAIRALSKFSLATLEKKLLMMRIRKMFKGLLTKRQINALANGKKINLKKLKTLRIKMLKMKKMIAKQRKLQKLQKNKGFLQKHQEIYLLKKKQKKLEKRTLIISK